LDEICSKTMDLLGEQIQRREENSSYSMVFLPKVIRRESTAARSQGRRKK
jgi:DNA-binding LacI/PurR family transcriptional regulator